MVQTMTDAYDALPAETQERVFMLAVGKDRFVSADQNFCKGSFGMCHDEPNDPWWNSWTAAQRDVFFFRRVGGDDWEYFCHYSMNQYGSQFADTVADMLALIPTTTTTTTAAAITSEQGNLGTLSESSANVTDNSGSDDMLEMEDVFITNITNSSNITMEEEEEMEEELEEEEEVEEDEELDEEEMEDIGVAIERSYVEDAPKELAKPKGTQQQTNFEEHVPSAATRSRVALSAALGLVLGLSWLA